jgi:ribosomal protein S18 acetylase RimI-like enzyme
VIRNGQFEIRSYRASDRRQLERVELPLKYVKQYTNAPPLHFVLKLLGICTNYLYLMTLKDSPKVVGTILLRKRLSPMSAAYIWKMHAVYVAPELRGRGLGVALVDHALRQLQKWRVPSVSLKVDEENEPAIRLYKKCGFAEKRTKNRQLIMFKRIIS